MSERGRDRDGTEANVRVLVVEDDPASSECLGEMLRFWGHDGRVAESGAQALALAADFRPHVAIVDFQLPDLDGAEVATRLRAEYGGAIVLIAFTGFSDASHRERAQRAGFDEFLVKPVDFNALQALLRRMLAPASSTPSPPAPPPRALRPPLPTRPPRPPPAAPPPVCGYSGGELGTSSNPSPSH